MLASGFSRFAETAAKEAVKEAAKEVVKSALPGVGRIIFASSSKGGVGKSTIAVNTAVALANKGNSVGIFDANIWGPSIPIMVGSQEVHHLADKEANFFPINAYGVETVSVGNVVPKEAAMMWRGPDVGYVIADFMKKAIWPSLDYLIIDTPPTTNDIIMALSTVFKVDGALLITTPQQVSRDDVARTINAFQNLGVPLLGVVQNMSGFVCPNCKKPSDIFVGKAADGICKKFHLDMFASIPLDAAVARSCETGTPAIIDNPDSEFSRQIQEIASIIVSRLPKVQSEHPARSVQNPPKRPTSIGSKAK